MKRLTGLAALGVATILTACGAGSTTATPTGSVQARAVPSATPTVDTTKTFRDPVGDVRRGPGPDITAVVVSARFGNPEFDIRFAAAPLSDPYVSPKDGLMILITTSDPSIGKKEAFLVSGNIGDLSLRHCANLTCDEQEPVEGVKVPAFATGKLVSVALPLQQLLNPKQFTFWVYADRWVGDNEAGYDNAPETGSWSFVLPTTRSGASQGAAAAHAAELGEPDLIAVPGYSYRDLTAQEQAEWGIGDIGVGWQAASDHCVEAGQAKIYSALFVPTAAMAADKDQMALNADLAGAALRDPTDTVTTEYTGGQTVRHAAVNTEDAQITYYFSWVQRGTVHLVVSTDDRAAWTFVVKLVAATG